MSKQRCYICKEYKNSSSFEYIPYLGRNLRKCKSCNRSIKLQQKKENKERRERKAAEYSKESAYSVKKYGVTPRVKEKLDRECFEVAYKRASKEILDTKGKHELRLYKIGGFLPNILAFISYIAIFGFMIGFYAVLFKGIQVIYIPAGIIGSITALLLIFIGIFHKPIESEINELTTRYKEDLFKLRVAKRKEYAKFYRTSEWRTLRDHFIKKQPKIKKRYQCRYCGCLLLKKEVHVDHVKPRSKYPKLALEESNLAISCQSCNSSKGNKDYY